MSRKTRSLSKQNNENEIPPVTGTSQAIALKKVFFIPEHLWKNSDAGKNLYLELFFHPGKGKPVLFVTNDDCYIMEVLEFAEPYRAWFLKDEVCCNGSAYMTTAFDVNFLALYYLSKHCRSRFVSMSEIHDSDAGLDRLMRCFIKTEYIKCLSDVKIVNGQQFYRYNHEKTLCWLSLKTRRIADFLRHQGVHCGQSAVSRNFIKCDKFAEETVDSTDYLRMAYNYIGNYLANDLYEELGRHLEIQGDMQTALNKRKSSCCTDTSNHKRKKLSNGTAVDTNASLNCKNEEVTDDEQPANFINKSIKFPKERNLSANEKSLARSAKGTQNIAKFFIKKVS